MEKLKPRIGLTAYPAGEGFGYHTPREYVDAVVRAGGVPMLMPPVGEDMVEAWLACLDGLVLVGGGDIDPELHGNEMHETIYSLNPVRDSTELKITRLAMAKNLPILAICRGLQLVNVARGGSLHVHLPEVVGEQIPHRSPSRTPVAHGVEVMPTSMLAKAMGTSQVTTSSWHHQAVDSLGEGLHAVAWAQDGTVEAIELIESQRNSGKPYLVAVQWHPELTAAKDESQQALFNDLVREAGQ